LALGEVQVHQQRGHWFEAHADAMVGMQRERVGLDDKDIILLIHSSVEVLRR